MKTVFEMLTFKELRCGKRDSFTWPLVACCVNLWLSLILVVISAYSIFVGMAL